MALLSFFEVFGYLWLFAVSLIENLISLWISFQRYSKWCAFQLCTFLKKKLCGIVVSKSQDLHRLMGYQWRENIQLFLSWEIKLFLNGLLCETNIMCDRSMADMPESVEQKMREITDQYGLDYDSMCTHDNRKCPW